MSVRIYLLVVITSMSIGTAAIAQSATTTEPSEASDNPTSEPYRTPVETLTERFLGSASRPVRFDWRKSPVLFALSGSELLERNNFGTFRIGGTARKAFGSFMMEFGVHYGLAIESESTRLLSLTPYRQAGRPNRFELDLNAGYPLIEGVVTPGLSFIPPAQVVLSGVGGIRYLLYREAFVDRTFLEVGRGLVNPTLSDDELLEIERNLPPGMQIDPARFHALVGFSLDVYFQPGIFITPRAMMALPVLAGATDTRLGFWWEMSFMIGYAL